MNLEAKSAVRRYLRAQWRNSLAWSIWDDLTPFGRLTIWLPIWLLCWLTIPAILVGAGIAIPAIWAAERLPKLPNIFFRD